jgi:hypothetical protein
MAVADQIKLRTSLATLNCSVASYAALAVPPMVKQKVSQQQLNLIVNGRTEIPDDDVKDFLSVTDSMEYLQSTVRPHVPIDWSLPLLVQKALIQAHKDRIEQQDPCPDTFYVLNLGSRGYFTKIRNGEVASMPSIAQAAAFSSVDQAGVATRELIFRFKERADWIPVPNHSIKRPMSQMVSSFEEVGLSGVPGPKPQ